MIVPARMLSRHRTLFHFTLALLGIVLLSVALFVAVGLSVMGKLGNPAVVPKLLGWERRDRLYWWYAHVAAGLLAGDRDKDGFRDGLEWFLGKDPNSAASQPEMKTFAAPGATFYLFCGDRMHARWCLDMSRGYGTGEFFPFPRGYQARWLIGSAGMASRIKTVHWSDQLIFNANADGELECDVEAGDKAESVTLWLNDEHDAQVGWGAIGWRVLGWRGKSEPMVFCNRLSDAFSPQPDPARRESYTEAFVAWPSAALQAPAYALERRRRHPGAAWEPMRHRLSQEAQRYRVKGNPQEILVAFAHFDGRWLDRGCGFEDYEWRMTEVLEAPPR